MDNTDIAIIILFVIVFILAIGVFTNTYKISKLQSALNTGTSK